MLRLYTTTTSSPPARAHSGARKASKMAYRIILMRKPLDANCGGTLENCCTRIGSFVPKQRFVHTGDRAVVLFIPIVETGTPIPNRPADFIFVHGAADRCVEVGARCGVRLRIST